MANQENIRKWVEALRSGKYQQTTGKLSDGQAYCCLGVACEIAIESGVKLKKTLEGDKVIYGQQGGELPQEVAEWLDLYFEDDYGEFLPISDPVLGAETAVEWNDEKDADFAEIADLIEKEFLTTERC